MKKTRLSFSSVSIEEDKSGKTNQTTGQATRPTYASPYTRIGGAQARGGEHRIGERKGSSKSSTYQYSKGGRGGGRGGNRSFNGKSQNKNLNESKIPVVEEGVIRIIPLGGVEEVGRNMILVESKDDIIVLDIGFHFIDEEEAMGADFTLPNFKYLEERKNKIRAVAITHGHLDHIGGIPFIMDRIGNPPIYAQYLTTLMIKKRQEEFPTHKPLDIHTVDEGSKIRFNQLSLGFFPVFHSIPDSMGV